MSKTDLVCGILHTSSKVSFGSYKDQIIRKFTCLTPFVYEGNVYNVFHVRTKLQHTPRDQYCVAKFISVKKIAEICIGSVDKYLGDIGDKDAENSIIKMICYVNWRTNKDFKGVSCDFDMYAGVRQPIINTNTNDSFNIYTIDPINCIDIDDALHIKKTNYGYEIGIHIADVSSYIPPGSPLDIELSNRCESIYLKNEQIDMLPPKLMNICSLIAGEPKRAHSLILNLDHDFNIINAEFGHYTIIVSENLDYNKAQALIDSPAYQDLGLLYHIGKFLFTKKYNTNSDVHNLYDVYNTYDTHKLVEVFMIMANTFAAEMLIDKQIMPPLRKHDGIKQIKNLVNYDIPKKIFDCANILQMTKAEYYLPTLETIHNSKGHVGLGLKYYTHFTSPIRRYVDIVIHRMLSQIEYPLNLNTKLSHINKTQKLYQKYSKLSYQLDKIYNLELTYGKTIEFIGYIIDLDIDKARIYVEEHDIILSTKFIPDKLKHLVDINNNDNNICFTSKYTSIELELFQKIKLRTVITNKLNNKLLSQIIEPNFSQLYMCDSEYVDSDEFYCSD